MSEQNTKGSFWKKVKIWYARNLKEPGVADLSSRTLKGICEKAGVSYHTAKGKQDKAGGKTTYVFAQGGGVWEIWVTEVL